MASKNLARIEFFVRILQDFLNLQETCKILEEINFLSTREITYSVEKFSKSQKHKIFQISIGTARNWEKNWILGPQFLRDTPSLEFVPKDDL